MATKLGLYKGALRVLGETTITDLTSTQPARYTLDEIYDSVGGKGIRELALSMGYWNFAMRTVEVSSDGDITPPFGYTYAFQKPTDWVRTAAVSASGDFNDPFNDYEDEQGYWFAYIDPLYVKYVSKDTDYGYDLTLWPANFTLFVEHLFAAFAAERVTQNRVKKADVMKVADDWLSTAKSTDAMNQPTRMAPRGSWRRARGGNRQPRQTDTGMIF